jgi:hypothetical protein
MGSPGVMPNQTETPALELRCEDVELLDRRLLDERADAVHQRRGDRGR